MKKTLSIFSMAILMAGCGGSADFTGPEIVDISKIGMQTPKQVAKLIGNPEAEETIHDQSIGCKKGCPKFTYLNGQVEVVYINGVADWITVTPQIKTLASSLTHPLYLIGGGPKDDGMMTLKNENTIHWSKGQHGKAPEMKVFLFNDTIQYYHIKLVTD